ncbi:hypothetical protein NFI96_006966 [Prochilodus magdalenae]|nr:hypothetical protein NFI96_006966 [Prochilodus magdalenae]
MPSKPSSVQPALAQSQGFGSAPEGVRDRANARVNFSSLTKWLLLCCEWRGAGTRVQCSEGPVLFGCWLEGCWRYRLCADRQQRLQERDIDIYSFHINSTVTSRYAVTVITSRVANRLTESKEVQFEVKIPKNAFISQFRMNIEGKTYDGVVKEKEEAQQQYSRAVSRGESAGMVSSVGRTLEKFKTSVTVAASSKVTFELTYEELLKRSLGRYEILINAQPMQPVADFKIDVFIHENPDISFLEVKGGLNTNKLANAVTTTRSGNKAWVNFYPTRDQQTKCDVCGENGLNGDLRIMYDVDRPKPSGELKASGGYFVHYFAPTNIQRIPKKVVFVIDRSGSMLGRKIIQTRVAMLKILGDLAEDDYFGLIVFDSHVEAWKPKLLKATQRNLKQAKDFVKKIEARGGECDPTKIQANVKETIRRRFPLYCLGFGFDVNFDFLEKMALENNGIARRIYEDSDADLQLQGFYEEVATPLLIGVQLNYTGAVNVTQTIFSHYYNGSEIVVAGQITDNSLDAFHMEAIAISKNSNVTYQDSVLTKGLKGDLPHNASIIQRLWAYLTVKQLLEKEVALNGQEKETAREEALNLSLRYKFVTPLTSMVVTKPQGEDTQIAHKPKEGKAKPEKLSEVRFLVSANAQSKPLCFDLPATSKLRLLKDPSSGKNDEDTFTHTTLMTLCTDGFSMNGMPSSKGFKQIAVHYKSYHFLMLSTADIHYNDGLSYRTFSWEQKPINHKTDSVSLILRKEKMDVTMGSVRVVFFRHKKDGEVFLWPAVQQQPKPQRPGILGKTFSLPYVELPGSVIRIRRQAVRATWSTATDYRRSSAPVLGCWLVPYQSVLPGELSDFTVSQLPAGVVMMDGATAGLALMGFLLICTAAPSVKERDIDIYSFHINSTVTSRYAVTVITSRVANRLTESKEVHFEVKIPKNAFISKFRMDMEGKTYDGVVKGKEEAQQQYSRAVSRGESAGKISSVGRTLEEFKTSVTVAALSKVTFELTYEELLTRRHGKYQLLINTQPMQPVADFKIDVYIHENPGIAFLEVKGGLNTNELANAVTTTRSGMQAWVNFYPTREQQTTCAVCGENGLNGDLIVMYDVDRPKPSGELKVSGGHFVHYFAPTDVPRIPKNVVFVIDRSGSMQGRKIQQTRDALLKILGDLAEDDHFGLITFDHNVEVWKPELLQATEGNLKTAKDFVRNINAHGATDINAAVLKGVEMINEHPREGSASILILLTDGAPNRGKQTQTCTCTCSEASPLVANLHQLQPETVTQRDGCESNPTRIQANVKEAIAGKFPLYCLGFGFDVNFNFLEKMALENKGLARRIYEDSDADLQLQGFYEEVATPLLTGVQLKYPGGANLTQTIFSHYYNGSEIVVAGQITDNSLDTFQMEVIAVSVRDYSRFRLLHIDQGWNGYMSDWPLMGSVVVYWPLVGLVVVYWPLVGSVVVYWPLMGLVVVYWPLVGLVVVYWPLMGLVVVYWPLMGLVKNTKVTYQDSVLTKDLVGFIPPHGNFIPRLWAYLTVKQLLEKEMTLNGAEKEAARKEVLDLSLKYQFVTPLTSMVVTKPEGEEAQVAHKPKEGEERKLKEHGPIIGKSLMAWGKKLLPSLDVRARTLQYLFPDGRKVKSV